ncbi:MAG: hypothetical protein JWM80_555 [Cyanobacteria bacterium RYN_339]|nr:hypothetical protein [Cyanobacteria bacterium RYN_339]
MPHPRLAAAAAAALVLLTASPVLACGGLFCARIPVDQTGEKILFAADGKTVTAHVEIAYKGEAKDFSWILPVPTPPTLEVGSDSLFAALRQASQPQFQLALRDEGPCAPPPMPVYKSAPSATGSVSRRAKDEVKVISQGVVGPYDTAVLQANQPGVLKDWLRKNKYVIPPKLDPLLDPYVAGKYSFVALKLTKDKAVGDIQPIVMTYKATKPGIPIRLTGVAATNDMDIFVWVLGSQHAIPENYRHAQINEARIDWIGGGGNYKQVVTRAVDEAGGQAFVTDYAGPSDVVPSERFTRAHYKLDSLAKKTDPAEFAEAVVETGFFGERYGALNQESLVAFLKKYIRKPKSLAKMDDMTFYRFIADHREALHEAGIKVDTKKAIAELDAKVVKPAEHIHQLFDRFHYMTAMYTTMSPQEMTQDPLFRFNATLADVPAIRKANGVRRCSKGVPYWQTPIEITLANGRKFTVPGGGEPYWRRRYRGPTSDLPAAERVEQLTVNGPPVVIQDNARAIDAALAEAPEPSDNRWYGGVAAGLLLLGGLGWGLRRRR